ncbi:MAG: hypothetical protein LBH43_16310 [Treponema sp.]|jgi:hypothetical protein|nr:hypothetical protein [Treponema sp.]
MAKSTKNLSIEGLFEIWADFDDSQSPREVKRLIEEYGLGPMDAASFCGFYFGYEKAIQKMNGFLLKPKRRNINAK